MPYGVAVREENEPRRHEVREEEVDSFGFSGKDGQAKIRSPAANGWGAVAIDGQMLGKNVSPFSSKNHHPLRVLRAFAVQDYSLFEPIFR
jgi:hypothetical protein